MLTLYHAGGLSAPVAAHIALEEAGAVYRTVRIDLEAGDQRQSEFLKLNPKGRVPVLLTERGVLTETVAILLYVAQTHPNAGLAPSDPFELARMQSFNAYLASTVHVAHSMKFRGSRWSDDPAAIATMQAKVSVNMRRCAEVIEHDYLVGPWVLGDCFTVSDPYLHLINLWMESDGVDIASFPRMAAHKAAMMKRPAVRKVTAHYSA
ncbi:MAG: glutathione S-transferase family protein [Hyphomicrobiaceae bacterium]